MKEYKEIFLSHLLDAYKMGLLSFDKNFLDYVENCEDIENNYILQSSVFSNCISSVYKDMVLIYFAYDINKACGRDLNEIGELLGLYRFNSKPSLIELEFWTNSPADYDIKIPKGTIVSTKLNGGIQFYTLEDTSIFKGQMTCNCSAYSVYKGQTGNKVGKNEISYIQSLVEKKTDKKIYVTNIIPSTGGRVEETDSEYRERIKKWPYLLKRGTIDCYVNYLDNVSGLKDYNIINMWDGPGTMKILINPGTDYLINKISEGLKEEVSIADEDIIIEEALVKTVDVDLIANVSIDNLNTFTNNDKIVLEGKLVDLIKVFIDGGLIKDYVKIDDESFKLMDVNYNGLCIGENFITQKCASFIDEQLRLTGWNPVKNISFNLPSSFTKSSTNDYYGNINDDETAISGIINVKIE
jgi:hypothetical protein